MVLISQHAVYLPPDVRHSLFMRLQSSAKRNTFCSSTRRLPRTSTHFTSDEDVPDPREFMRQRDELVKYASHCSGDVVHLMALTGSFKRARLVRKHVRMLSRNSSLLASLAQQRSPSPIALNPARLHHLSDPRKPNLVQPRSMVVRRERPSRKVSISDPLCARLVSTL